MNDTAVFFSLASKLVSGNSLCGFGLPVCADIGKNLCAVCEQSHKEHADTVEHIVFRSKCHRLACAFKVKGRIEECLGVVAVRPVVCPLSLTLEARAYSVVTDFFFFKGIGKLLVSADKISDDDIHLYSKFPLLKSEQIPGESYEVGDHIKVFVMEVKNEVKGPIVTLSRTHFGLVKRLFELEVPEIQDGTVVIRGISREAGSRTKIAVESRDENVDPVGACIGNRGSRINGIVNELNGEKIDVIAYSEDPEAFVKAALSPAEVKSVSVVPGEKSCRVIVPEDQLSLAIGREGQNARLAARLTGYKIDIKTS